MPQFNTQKQNKKGYPTQQFLSYNEIISYLDANWSESLPDTIKKINLLLGNIAPKLPAIVITGTSGKSSTIYYLAKLLQAEGIKIGTFLSPHFTIYNERFSLNNSMISNETFTKLANTVIEAITTNNINASSKDILTAMSLLYFNKETDIVIIEQEQLITYDPITIYTPKILGITRIVSENKEKTTEILNNILKNITKTSSVACADQSKILLQTIAKETKKRHSTWIMPIRKLAPLPYPYEQLHGRCAALAERIAHTYIETKTKNINPSLSLLKSSKKQRGRPRLTSKYNNTQPENNTETFWKNIDTTPTNSFQVIVQKKSTIIVDSASNIDALQNLLLGVRLLNYKKSFNNISFLFGYNQQFSEYELIKIMRYFFKKISGNLIFCPTTSSKQKTISSHSNIEKIVTTAQNAKINVTSFKQFQTAYESTIKHCDNPQDVIVITGSNEIISEYWKYEKSKISEPK